MNMTIPPASLLLRHSKEKILKEWEHRVLHEIPAARGHSSKVVINSLPHFLDIIAEGLTHPESWRPLLADKEIARVHGESRTVMPTYTLNQIVREYRILREVLTDCLGEALHPQPELQKQLHAMIDVAIEYAASAFVEVVDREQVSAGIDRTRLESDLRLERDKLAAVFRQSPAALALFRGPQMIFELINPGYQSLFPGRQLLGKTFHEALPEFIDQPFRDLLVRVLNTGEPYIGHEILARHRSTIDSPLEEHYYDFVFIRINDGAGKPYGVYDHRIEVTERVLARQALEEGNSRREGLIRDLERERELREHFVSALTHDMRTPLTAVRMTAQLLERMSDPQRVAEYSKRIVRGVDRADSMIRDLLDANRIKAGQGVPIAVEECRLDQIAQAVAADLAQTNGTRILVDNAEGAFPGFWDAQALRRILENLCTNAIKYGTSSTPVTVGLRSDGAQVKISVHNEGRPIPAEDQRHLFLPYRRTGMAERSGQKGWGVGLTIVRGLAEAHGGGVSVASDHATGTTFSVRLPRDARELHT